ncbi:MAG: KOW motif domain-containing protein [Bdellovibrionales bacterium]
MKLKIKKGDTVQVIAGADKGKKGAVLTLDKNKLKVKIQGVRVQTHFNEQEGLQQMEGFVDYSNVKFVSAAAKTAKKKTKKKAAAKA